MGSRDSHRASERHRAILGPRATTAAIVVLVLLALALLASGVWFTQLGDTRLWYEGVPIP
ncbi:MAG: hypothetical protein JNJ54_30135 [Myxococcaceae bacterium]|nr:hypothetical protein [Myxococcaceae bacterium]